ncbi:MAG: hypothetical protein WA919_12090 [Coleofasciculaceae cyanobacterium]
MTTTTIGESKEQKTPLRKKRILMAAGAAIFLAIGITAVVVNSPREQKPVTEIDIAQAQKNASLRQYIEQLTRVDLAPDTLENPGLLQQQYALLSQELLRDVSILRNTKDHPSYRLTEAGALHQQTQMVMKLAWLAQKGQNATLTYQDGEKEVSISVPPSELAAIAYGRLWAISMAENLRVSPRFNTRLTMTQLVALQQEYKKDQAALLGTLGMMDAVSQIDSINSWLLEEGEKSSAREHEERIRSGVMSNEGTD